METGHLFIQPPYQWDGLYVKGESPFGKECVIAACESSDDAEFIARACNSHDALVKALQRFIAYGDVFGHRRGEESPYDQAREAIAEAERK